MLLEIEKDVVNMKLIDIFITSILTGNIILTKFLGICPFIGTSDREKNAIGMGISVSIVVTISSILTYLIYHYILVPTDTTYLKTIIFILIIASMVQVIELLLKKYFPSLHQALGIYLPLITTNCAVLGIALLNVNNEYNFLQTLVFSIGSSIGFTLVMYLFASIRERMETSHIPRCFKGAPIALITAAIMALLFSRYGG